MKRVNSLFIFIALIINQFASAQALKRDEVPELLTPWVDWVLQDETDFGCPYHYNSSQKSCVWPSRLNLTLGNNGGQFTQRWRVFAPSLVRLPGDAKHWPLAVRSEQGALLVQSNNGVPYVALPAGEHRISGQFQWQKLPKSLHITPESGLVALTVNGQFVQRPQFDEQGQLWLMQADTEKVSQDNIDMQVFRRIIDGHPITVETLIKLRVSGKQRNANLSSALLEQFMATRINSQLPAKLEANNQLKVQLRPGEWSITVIGRAPADKTQFAMPETQQPWPEQEVWVFAHNNNMRQVQVTGVTSIDPNQTRLPEGWRGLPAYLLSPKQILRLDVRERGITDLARNDLRLTREMWLDFNGKGYSIKDQIDGQIHQSRINVLPDIELGRVSINQQPQFITRETGKQAAGVEVRQKTLNLTAESRYLTSPSQLPVSGWQVDLQKVDTTLHLPPGWRVLAVFGADNLPNSWMQKWSLMDLFLVLIIVLSIRHFYGWRWAGFALITLILTWQEANAPTLIWLNLLAVTALLRVLPEHKFSNWLRNYRWLSLFMLAVILLTYTIDTVRMSFYPQLERGYTQQWRSTETNKARQQAGQTRLDNAAQALEEVVVSARMNSSAYQPKLTISRKHIDLKAIDPNSQIQSGPGLPSWRGYHSVGLHWSGPVKANETSRIWLLNPMVNLILRLFGVALLLGLAWCFVRHESTSGGSPLENTADKEPHSLIARLRSWIKPVAAVCVFACLLPVLEPVQAQAIPDQAMLDTLKQRLTKAPTCLRNCAQIEQMAVVLSAQRLQTRLRVHALTKVSVPLPGSQGTWLPQQVLVNGKPATALARDDEQLLWLSLPAGLHDVALSGSLSQRASLPLPLPLKPNYISWRSDDNSWTLAGIDENGVAKSQLQLNRVITQQDPLSFQDDHNALPTFVKVQRQLQLGLDWYVQTTVTRVSPHNVPLNISVPLLAGEQLLDDQLQVQKQQVALHFTANQQRIHWSSRLEPTTDIVLTATDNMDYLETWHIDASPVWHVQAQGLPVTRYLTQPGEQLRTVPEWKPWPGESLKVTVDRPVGVAGQTVTVQGSQLTVNTGKRVNEIELKLAVRSSRGVQHQIQLPDGADVQELKVGNVSQRIQTTDKLLSMTLKPGKQDVLIRWREPSAQTTHYQFPKVNLKLPSVNAHSAIKLPRNRWVLWAQGPVVGPAVLFWGVLSALLVLSIILGLSKLTPLKSWQWFLLAIGLSQTSPVMIVVVVVCLLGLSLREKITLTLSRVQFNTMQLVLTGLIITSLGIMVTAVANGLLGSPDMQIAGNGSHASFLKWYQDRATAVLPQPQIISVPIWLYRVLMLAWAMWLAMSLLKWIQWGWQALNAGGFWRKKSVIKTTSEFDKEKT